MRYGSDRRPRRTSQQSNGDGTAPSIVWMARMRSKKLSIVRATTTPPRTSEWPLRYFVVECITTSTPSSSGRCSTGVAHVLSTTVRAPMVLASATIARMSVTCRRGLDGVSIQINRVEGVSARFTAPGSVMSTNVVSQPPARELVAQHHRRAVVRVLWRDHVRARIERLKTAAVAADPEANAAAADAALERRQCRLERLARGIAGSGVVEPVRVGAVLARSKVVER